MKPTIKSLYRNVETDLFYRVVDHSVDSDKIRLVSMKGDASCFSWPFDVEQDFITQNNDIRKCDVDPFSITREDISEAEEKIRDSRWKVVEALLAYKGIYDPVARNKMVRANSKGRNKVNSGIFSDFESIIEDVNLLAIGTTYRTLKYYWIYGMTKNSLLPGFSKCGGKGKEKKPSLTIGRSQKVPKDKILITERIRKQMHDSIAKNYVKNPKNGKHHAYVDFLDEYFKNSELIPTERQFSYRLNKLSKNEVVIRARLGSRKFDKDERLTVGNSRMHAFGPGTETQIDSTIDNIRVLSSLFKNFYSGRLTLYLIVDLATGMVTGFYLTPEAPKCEAAFMAILNSASDKVELAKDFGLEISPDDWPWKYLPGKVMADRGELVSNKADLISDNLGIDLSNAPSYRPDLKGCIERMIKTLQDRLVGLLTEVGAIGKDDGERGVADSRKKATLTLQDIEQLLFKEVIYHNHHT